MAIYVVIGTTPTEPSCAYNVQTTQYYLAEADVERYREWCGDPNASRYQHEMVEKFLTEELHRANSREMLVWLSAKEVSTIVMNVTSFEALLSNTAKQHKRYLDWQKWQEEHPVGEGKIAF
jgi:hypothetical protein